MRKLIFVFVILIQPILGIAQNTPAFRQFYFNPVTFNPAYAGASNQPELYVALRKQWLGFNDAPTYTGINFIYPTSGRVSFAFNAYEQEVVALRNSSAMATFAYRIPIAENQSLFFGLSGGVGFNNLDLGGIDYSNDPTIMNASVNTTYADGNFGLLYERGNLRLGFALPKLFGQKYFAPSQLDNIAFSQLRNQNYSASYKFYTRTLSIEPWALYRMSRDNANSWDAGATVTFKEIFWLGGAYSDAQGIAAFAGIDVKERFRLGYSYEIPTSGFSQTPSHELQLRFRFGKKRDFRWAAKFSKPIQNDSVTSFVSSPKPDARKVEIGMEQKDTTKTISVPIAIPKESPLTQKKDSQPKENIKPVEKRDSIAIVKSPVIQNEIERLTPGYYIVTGNFKSIDNAKNLMKGLKTKGFKNAAVSFNGDSGLYVVHVFHSISKDAVAIAAAHFQEAGLKTYFIKHVE